MNYLNEAINSIAQSIRFPSVRAEAKENMPFGQGAYDCLHHFLALAESFGFRTVNYDNYAGEVIFGSGEDFAVLAHLDVVPAGEGWSRDPFGGQIEDGRIWGRGAIDDKGPAICALYAMKALKDRGFCPGRTIKLIVGCNEEDGWACIEHYKQCAALPREGISPDADFPVIYAEKGILHIQTHFPIKNAPFSSFSGGTSANMVCASCTAAPLTLHEERAKKYGLICENGVLKATGKSAHGSTPEAGINAIAPLLAYFSEENDDALRVKQCLFDDLYGLKTLCDETGRLTLSPDMIEWDGESLNVLCDIRYPATLKKERVTALLAKFGIPYEEVHFQEPLFTDKNGALVQTLLSVYEECTGEKAQPIAIGGGTYARALEHGVAFGPEMKGDEPVIHQANEYITVERVKLLLELYEKALERLCG